MRIEIVQMEIEEAIRDWVGKQGVTVDQGTSVSLSATRGPQGITATIDFNDLPKKPLPTSVSASEDTDPSTEENPQEEAADPPVDGNAVFGSGKRTAAFPG
jgi:hypothetical protein